MTARENIMFAAHFFHKNSGHLIRKHWNNMLEIVGLTGKADRPIEGFSGGKKQCLGIALAQVNQPDLLIFDEQAASRVSDSVAILNQGVLAAIGPIKQIIQGSDCFIYTACNYSGLTRFATGDGSFKFPSAYAALQDDRTVFSGAAHSCKQS